MEKINRIIFSFLFAAIVLAGCATQRTDPLAGWTFREFDQFAVASQQHHYQLDKSVADDYQNFIAKNNLDLIGAITGFYEDGTGRHAVEFEGYKNHTSWHYVLIYNKDNKRINLIKYNRSRFSC